MSNLNEWDFQSDFGGEGSTKSEQDKWEARKYGTFTFPEAPSTKERKRVRQQKAARKRSGNEKKPTGRRPVFDRQEIQRLYEAGQTVPDIAAQVGANRDTVWKILKELGIYQPKRDLGVKSKGQGGRPKKDRCIRGHDLTDEDNLLWTTDSKTGRRKRECKRCKYDRTAAAKRAKRLQSGEGV